MKRFYRAVLFILVLFAGGFLWLKFRPTPVAKPATTVVSAPSPTPTPTPQPTPSPEPSPVPVAEQAKEPAGPRTWTSNDGRTLKAEFLAATSTSVTVRREDRTVFTIPLSRLSADDVAWVDQQPKTGLVAPAEPDPIPSPAIEVAAAPKTPAVTQKQLDQLLARFPNAPSLSGEVTNDLQQLHVKYHGMVKFIRPNSVGATIKMIRTKILDDVKVLSAIAGTSAGDWTGKRGSSQSAAAENGILSARRSVAWLQGPLSTYINNYDAFVVE